MPILDCPTQKVTSWAPRDGTCPESQAHPEWPGAQTPPATPWSAEGGKRGREAGQAWEGQVWKGRATLHAGGQTPSACPAAPQRERALVEFNVPSILVRVGSRTWRVQPTSRRGPGRRSGQTPTGWGGAPGRGYRASPGLFPQRTAGGAGGGGAVGKGWELRVTFAVGEEESVNAARALAGLLSG